MALDSIGNIATFLIETIEGVSDGVSGNMVIIVDMNRQHVENFTGTDIGSNNIADQFQPPIVNLSKADTIDFIQAQVGGEKLKLGELSIDESGDAVSSQFWRDLAESQLNALGRRTEFRRSLS